MYIHMGILLQILIVHDNKILCILIMCISKYYTKLLNCMYISASKFIWNIILTCYSSYKLSINQIKAT